MLTLILLQGILQQVPKAIKINKEESKIHQQKIKCTSKRLSTELKGIFSFNHILHELMKQFSDN